MALLEKVYNRDNAVDYAHKWAYKRNPQYYDFTNVGGDCTSFASQCVYAGTNTMNYTPTYGWYYRNVNDRAPAWTSVEYLYRFLVNNKGVGPYAIKSDIDLMELGDLIQIRFKDNYNFGHTLVIVDIEGEKTLDNIKIASHSYDADYKPVSKYKNVVEVRFLHILGYRKKLK